MGRLTTVLSVVLVAFLAGCTGSNPIQRELGQAAGLQLANNTAESLDFELVAGTTPNELQRDDIVARVSLAPGESTHLTTYPGRYTLFPHKTDAVGIRTLAYNGVRLGANLTQNVTISVRTQETMHGPARHMVFQAT